MKKLSKQERIEKHNFVEHSAGGIVYRIHHHRPQILLMLDMKQNWTFPKGWIEEGESIEAAARREIAEEVGVTDLTLVMHLETVKYHYYFQGKIVHKIVDYFLFSTKGTEPLTPQLEEGIQKVSWLSLDEAQKIIGYPQTNGAVLQKAIAHLQQ